MFWYNKGFYDKRPNEGAIELSDEKYDQLMKDIGDGGQLIEDENGYPVVVEDDVVKNNRLNNIRISRNSECFSIINRGVLWYNTLTEQQKIELNDWYLAWLDVTETKIIPQKPEWLK